MGVAGEMGGAQGRSSSDGSGSDPTTFGEFIAFIGLMSIMYGAFFAIDIAVSYRILLGFFGLLLIIGGMAIEERK